jgi:hypothetical protein
LCFHIWGGIAAALIVVVEAEGDVVEEAGIKEAACLDKR